MKAESPDGYMFDRGDRAPGNLISEMFSGSDTYAHEIFLQKGARKEPISLQGLTVDRYPYPTFVAWVLETPEGGE